MAGRQGRILVIRGGAIGDFILTLPVFAALRRAFPSAHITVLGYPWIAGLALAGRLVDEVQALEGRDYALFFSPKVGADLPAEPAAFFAGFDLIVSYLFDPDRTFETNVHRVSQAQFFAGSHRPGTGLGRHATEVFLEPLQALAIFDADPVPRLRLPRSSAGVKLRGNGQHPPAGTGWLGAHPGSGSERKNWPEERWARLLAELSRHTPESLLLVGGEAEQDRLSRLAPHWPADRLRIARNEPLVQLATRLAGCTAFLGHDSGITHLAAALGVPVLAMWGETDPAIWSPRGSGARLLRPEHGLGTLSEERVLAGLLDLLAAGKDA